MLLEKIKNPNNLKKFSVSELDEIAKELRETIISTVAVNGGHLASNLGVVELTLALHYVFDSPLDKIIWDVGHQSYVHKLLTGRYDEFPTLRMHRGISGFPKITENEHDAFGTGHSSTSISAALGILEGRDQNKERFKVIAVIGDGALTAGLAFEGLNHAGQSKKDLIVILNDNEMSISPNVGALSAYLRRIMMSNGYNKFRKETRDLLKRIPHIGEPVLKIAQKAEDTVKGASIPGVLFEELGFEYIGPLDGHKVGDLISVIRSYKDVKGPVLIHVITKKGKGYDAAEKNPEIFHSAGPFDIKSGKMHASSGQSYSNIFGNYLAELAEKDKRIVAITAAMTDGTGLTEFAKRFPDRIYDVGIAEPHAATFAAGLATQGLKPVVAIYSTFLQRAYDEIIHDICLQNLPVVFAIDRAGIVGNDGPTHNGSFDFSFLRHIPNLVLMAPKDGHELKQMLRTALSLNKPVAIRYPRGSEAENKKDTLLDIIPVGKSEVLREGKDLLLIAIGSTVETAISAAGKLSEKGIDTCVINARFVKPLDTEMINSKSEQIKKVIVIEENSVMGGFGSAILEQFADNNITDIKIKLIGIPDSFIEQGTQSILRQKLGLDVEGIVKESLLLIEKNHK
ncbi:MAG: 1-deoxy-D-xylulose-5-phosphate synthase [Patescibacteria group bacterium]